MDADGHVKIYDKEKFKQIVQQCLDEFEKSKEV